MQSSLRVQYYDLPAAVPQLVHLKRSNLDGKMAPRNIVAEDNACGTDPDGGFHPWESKAFTCSTGL